MHQEDKPRNTIGIDRTVGTIVLGPQYNLKGGYFFESLLTVKCLRSSHFTPVNMTEDVIEQYKKINTKGCPEDLIFGYFNNKPIPSTYYDLIHYHDGNGTPIYAAIKIKEGVEDAFLPKYKYTNDEITTDNNYSLASDIGPPPNKILQN